MARRPAPWAVILLLSLAAAAAVAAFMTIGVRGNWAFVLSLRATKVAVMAVVAYAVAVSTVLFQTVTNNRILTPAIMGFDHLYLLIQTAAVFLLGSGAVAAVDHRLRFALEVAVMVAFSLLLYGTLFAKIGRASCRARV